MTLKFYSFWHIKKKKIQQKNKRKENSYSVIFMGVFSFGESMCRMGDSVIKILGIVFMYVAEWIWIKIKYFIF